MSFLALNEGIDCVLFDKIDLMIIASEMKQAHTPASIGKKPALGALSFPNDKSEAKNRYRELITKKKPDIIFSVMPYHP